MLMCSGSGAAHDLSYECHSKLQNKVIPRWDKKKNITDPTNSLLFVHSNTDICGEVRGSTGIKLAHVKKYITM